LWGRQTARNWLHRQTIYLAGIGVSHDTALSEIEPANNEKLLDYP